jgi:hypothetical protein
LWRAVNRRTELTDITCVSAGLGAAHLCILAHKLKAHENQINPPQLHPPNPSSPSTHPLPPTLPHPAAACRPLPLCEQGHPPRRLPAPTIHFPLAGGRCSYSSGCWFGYCSCSSSCWSGYCSCWSGCCSCSSEVRRPATALAAALTRPLFDATSRGTGRGKQ